MFHACPNPDCAVHEAGGLFPEAMPCVLCGTPLAEARIAVDPVSSSGGARTDEERAIVEGYPYVMALPYSRMLQEPDGRNRLELLAYTLQNALKYMGLSGGGRIPCVGPASAQAQRPLSPEPVPAVLRQLECLPAGGHQRVGGRGHTWRFPEIGRRTAKWRRRRRSRSTPRRRPTPTTKGYRHSARWTAPRSGPSSIFATSTSVMACP